MEIQIEWDWETLVNSAFLPLIENKDRYLVCIGGRGSSKSDFCCRKLIYRCLNESYFRCLCIRNTYGTLKESSYQTLKDLIFEMGLESLFEFKLQPLEIICVNGNRFLFRGCDDTRKLKSVKDPSAVWYEEDIISEKDFITITTSVRTTKADYLQEIFTVNPEVEGDYKEHWFYKRFFENNPTEKTFGNKTAIKLTKDLTVELSYYVHHSTYKDNRFVPNEFKAFLEELKIKNPYYYNIYCLGEFGNRQSGDLFYKLFSRATNVSSDISYNPLLPLHISFDFNVNPYMSCTIWQMQGKVAMCVNELATVTPKNTTKGLCQELMRLYMGHKSGMFIYGDPAGKSQDTRSEKGYNDYKIIENELSIFKPTLRVASKHPPVVMRGNFINTIFQDGFNGISIIISDKCTHLINDFLFGKEAPDGTKHKEKAQKDGITYEKYFHHSDTMDYMICEAFKSDFNFYQNGSPSPKPIFGYRERNPSNSF